jgi:hypothetical protein
MTILVFVSLGCSSDAEKVCNKVVSECSKQWDDRCKPCCGAALRNTADCESALEGRSQDFIDHLLKADCETIADTLLTDPSFPVGSDCSGAKDGGAGG